MKKILYLLSILSIYSMVSCGETKKQTIDTTPPIPVKLESVSSNNNKSFITASGKIEAENSANISTRMMGYVTMLKVSVGQKVAKGQLLVSISNSDLQAKKSQVEASILQATAGYNNAKKDYERFVNLFKQQSASQKELDDMTARYEMAKAGLEGAKQMKNEVMAQFAYANISAPFSGVITNTFVKEGDMANPGMPLLSIEGASRLQVTAMVSESDIYKIKTGTIAKVLVKSTNENLTGNVSEVSLSAKNTGGQYLVKIDLDKTSDSILSGMFVNVEFPIESELTDNRSDDVYVSEKALVKKGQLTGVYTVNENKIAILRWLRTGKTIGGEVEVLSGLSSGENYVISSEGKLYNGAKVVVE